MTLRQVPQSIPSDQALDAATQHRQPAARASVPDTLRVVTQVVGPTLLAGVIKRRPRAMALAQKLQVDRPAVRLHQRLRRRYGDGPLHLRLPGRSIDLMLSPDGVGALLAGTPSPFSPASREKVAALRHFQPHGVLISDGAERTVRREFNEAVLEPGRPVHELAGVWTQVIGIQVRAMLQAGDTLDWDTFNEHWWTVVRQVTLGGDTVEDREVTDLLAQLRRDGNWAYAHPLRRRTRERFSELVCRQIDLKRPGSLAAVLTSMPSVGGVDPAGQLPHWLFAFDAAGIVTFRTLALLASHPDRLAEVRAELDGLDLSEPRQLPRLRACVLESVRLWPTTPAVLRESRGETEWGPDRTTFLVFTPYFHRDGERLPYADSFEPGIWLDGRAADDPALVPFSGGPGACPGRDLVLFATSMVLANLVQENDFRLLGATLPPDRLPLTLDNFGLRFNFGDG